MKLLELTLETPEENLALDEALLEVAEAGKEPGEVLRLWESPGHVVVLGRSSNAQAEVNLDACRRRGIPVLRRASGGATVLIGPGCLMYAVVLSYERRPQLRMIEMAHQFVLERLRRAIEPQVPEITSSGTSDLTMNLQKFSGNSLRCRQRHLLYHGTIVYDFCMAMMSECLAAPARQPDYRNGRTHQDFVANIPIDPDILRCQLAHTWEAASPLQDWPSTETARVVAERYSQAKWRIGGN
ncbi:MAG TPA: lipoate--protein ligase family protein [Pirellulaceae bacterium]|jgi:lipoate-protein ligase A|nr:lipoate--protein ligase family protein [Pirellulaceae bacterium]